MNLIDKSCSIEYFSLRKSIYSSFIMVIFYVTRPLKPSNINGKDESGYDRDKSGYDRDKSGYLNK